MKFPLSQKYIDFIKTESSVEFLEGTTYAGKTTVGIVKYIFQVAKSPKRLHVISALDTGVIEKNIINKESGLLEIFGNVLEYNPSGKGLHSLPHIILHSVDGEDKIIYILGYNNVTRWKKALGGQYGCVYIDEINVADMDYVREIAMRCDYLLATLNPDNPNLPIYKEYINKARPIEKYKNDAPNELLQMLNEPPNENWHWWYFSFEHNAWATQEKIEKIKMNSPQGTKQYKNKILGLRGKATGLVFSNFSESRHVISKEELSKRNYQFVQFSCGVDTAYSSESADTIAILFLGITKCGTCIVLDERVYDNNSLDVPIAPSDTIVNIVDFLNRNKEEHGITRSVFIDSADQATLTEAKKYKLRNPCIYDFGNAWKQTKIIDRINMQLGWFHKDKYLVLNHCKHHIHELNNYSWKENKDSEPEDCNDHTVNASQYGWLPFIKIIGGD